MLFNPKKQQTKYSLGCLWLAVDYLRTYIQ